MSCKNALACNRTRSKPWTAFRPTIHKPNQPWDHRTSTYCHHLSSFHVHTGGRNHSNGLQHEVVFVMTLPHARQHFLRPGKKAQITKNTSKVQLLQLQVRHHTEAFKSEAVLHIVDAATAIGLGIIRLDIVISFVFRLHAPRRITLKTHDHRGEIRQVILDVQDDYISTRSHFTHMSTCRFISSSSVFCYRVCKFCRWANVGWMDPTLR